MAIVQGSLSLSLNGITTTLGNIYCSGISDYGLQIQNNSGPNIRTVISDYGIFSFTGTTGAQATALSGTAASGGVLEVYDASGNVTMSFLGYNSLLSITKGGNSIQISATTVTAGSATAGSQTLPSNPAGFWTISLNGSTAKIPYYNF